MNVILAFWLAILGEYNIQGVRHFPNKRMRFHTGVVVVRFANHMHAIGTCAVTV